MAMEIDLRGQVVLVTGASRGIGRAIALRLGEAGATVAVHYRRQEEEAEHVAKEAGNGSLPFQANLADPEATRQLFACVRDTYGRVHGLVNNAGIARYAPLDGPVEQWLQAWEETMAVNLRAAGILCREAVLHFQEAGGGRIVNISSRAAFRGDTPEYLAYGVSKAGMLNLTRTIARYMGKQNIVAFTVAPGFVRTDMARDFMDMYGEEIALSDIALNRLTEPDDIAPTVVFLLSGLADHATGTTIDINAGSYVH